jgi:hypothetical protein
MPVPGARGAFLNLSKTGAKTTPQIPLPRHSVNVQALHVLSQGMTSRGNRASFAWICAFQPCEMTGSINKDGCFHCVRANIGARFRFRSAPEARQNLAQRVKRWAKPTNSSSAIGATLQRAPHTPFSRVGLGIRPTIPFRQPRPTQSTTIWMYLQQKYFVSIHAPRYIQFHRHFVLNAGNTNPEKSSKGIA